MAHSSHDVPPRMNENGKHACFTPTIRNFLENMEKQEQILLASTIFLTCW